jgi:hypothetical protein
MLEEFDSYTFFPAQYWSHAWERQHELIYRLSQVINKEVNIFLPLGLVNYNPVSVGTIKKVIEKAKKSKSINNNNRTLENMNFISSAYIHSLDNLSAKINYHILKGKVSVEKNNFFWSTYINPTVYEFFKKSSFKVIDLAERRQANKSLSLKMKELEQKAVSEANIVFVDNLATLEDYRHLNENIFYVPQGYDSERISLNTNKNSKKIGYIGHLHSHINYEYLFNLIENNSDQEFLIVGGGLDSKAKELEKFKNVVLTGQVPKDDLPLYLKEMKFGLIPYNVDEFTSGVFPTKLFEYLGAGCAVISTPIPEVTQYKNDKYIFIDETPKKIDHIVNFTGIENFLKENTWSARFDEYVNHINRELL